MCWRDDLMPMSYWTRDRERAARQPAPPPPPVRKCRVYPDDDCAEKEGCDHRKLGCAIERPF